MLALPRLEPTALEIKILSIVKTKVFSPCISNHRFSFPSYMYWFSFKFAPPIWAKLINDLSLHLMVLLLFKLRNPGQIWISWLRLDLRLVACNFCRGGGLDGSISGTSALGDLIGSDWGTGVGAESEVREVDSGLVGHSPPGFQNA